MIGMKFGILELQNRVTQNVELNFQYQVVFG